MFVKSSSTADLILCAVLLTVEKVAELLSVGRQGQIVQAQPRRHNVKLSPGPSKWKALFRTLLPLEVINPSAGKLVICVKGLSYIYKASGKKNDKESVTRAKPQLSTETVGGAVRSSSTVREQVENFMNGKFPFFPAD